MVVRMGMVFVEIISAIRLVIEAVALAVPVAVDAVVEVTINRI